MWLGRQNRMTLILILILWWPSTVLKTQGIFMSAWIDWPTENVLRIQIHVVFRLKTPLSKVNSPGASVQSILIFRTYEFHILFSREAMIAC